MVSMEGIIPLSQETVAKKCKAFFGRSNRLKQFKSFLFASQKQSNSLCRTAPTFHVRHIFDKGSVTMI